MGVTIAFTPLISLISTSVPGGMFMSCVPIADQISPPTLI